MNALDSMVRDVSPLGVATLNSSALHSQPPRLDSPPPKQRWQREHLISFDGREVAVDLGDGTTIFGRALVGERCLELRLLVVEIPCRVRIPWDQIKSCRMSKTTPLGPSIRRILSFTPRLTWRLGKRQRRERLSA